MGFGIDTFTLDINCIAVRCILSACYVHTLTFGMEPPDILLVEFSIALDAKSDLSRVSAKRRQVWKYTISFTNAKMD